MPSASLPLSPSLCTMEASQVASLLVADLRKELADRGLSTKGVKKDLVKR